MSKTSGTNSVHTQAKGPTFTENDPAKFGNGGRGRKTAANGVVDQGTGPTFTENSTHIPTMNADKPAKESKVIRTGAAPQFLSDKDDACNASTEGTSAGTPDNTLKASYEKRGRSGR